MKIIAVTSGKGGTGKSCVAAYTGAALAQRGRKVILLELGGDSRSLDVILGVPDTTLFSVHDVINDLCSLEQAVSQTVYCDNLHLVPCALNALTPKIGGDRFGSIVKELDDDFDYDYLVLDGADFSQIPPGSVDTIINVTNPETISIRSAAALTRVLCGAGAKEVRLVINNVPPQILPMAGVNDFDDIIDVVGARLLAIIPSSPKLRYASNNTAPLADDSIIPKVFECLAARLEGETRPLLIR